VRITFAGSGKEFERRQTAAAGFEYLSLPCKPLPRHPREAFSFVVENVAGYLAAGRLLREEHVAAVVGLGGYASVPMGRAAARHGLPLVLLEQNAVLGKANRWLMKSAKLICTSFEETETRGGLRCPVRVTGNPIRRLPAVEETPAVQPQLLILGGSGGARSLNENVPRALYKLHKELAGWRIVHQTGEADVDVTRELYRKLAVEAIVEPFFADLPDVMARSSLAVCRAGGTTLAELAAAGVPAVLLPYPYAVADHQRKNADVFVAAGAACLVDPREVSGRLDDRLAETISGLTTGAGEITRMSAAMRGLARADAAAQVASLVWSLVNSQSRAERVPAAV
jgi:UDP-N-acetylglucosamine--N-acetylmuramyl-(pentapeptide) pyrophosphoryl-undecaprenol N-acetylglucosamine transferase